MRRHWFLIVLAALLVMRAWAGEAMAGQMLTQKIQAAAGAQATQVAHVPDCHGHQADAGDAPLPKSCNDCQDCSLNALPATPVTMALVLPQAPRAHLTARFASAEPRAGFEPPVS